MPVVDGETKHSSPSTTGRRPSSDAQNRARRSSASSVASSSDAASIAARVASVCTRGASIGKSTFVTPPSSSTRSGRTRIRGSPGEASERVTEIRGADAEDDVMRAVGEGRLRRQRQAETGERDATVAHRGLDDVHGRRADECGDEQVRGIVVQPLRRVALLQHRRRASRRCGRPASSPRPDRA